jgi:hypothetical protein
MFSPMFRNEVEVLGLPPGVASALLGFGAMLVALWWIRRTLDIEPEMHSFRATAPAPPNRLLRMGLVLGLIAVALAAVALAR